MSIRETAEKIYEYHVNDVVGKALAELRQPERRRTFEQQLEN